MVMAVVAKINIDPLGLLKSKWVHDKAHEFISARIDAIVKLEKLAASRR